MISTDALMVHKLGNQEFTVGVRHYLHLLENVAKPRPSGWSEVEGFDGPQALHDLACGFQARFKYI